MCVKYAINDAHVPTVKSQNISNDAKEVISDILKNNFDKRLFNKLQTTDKRLVKRFVNATKLDIDITDDLDKDFQHQYEILKGEFISGSTSPLLINELKKYIIQGMQENKIPRNECYMLLYQLSL